MYLLVIQLNSNAIILQVNVHDTDDQAFLMDHMLDQVTYIPFFLFFFFLTK